MPPLREMEPRDDNRADDIASSTQITTFQENSALNSDESDHSPLIFHRVVQDLLALNPHCVEADLSKRALFEAEGTTLKSWGLNGLGLVVT